MATEPIQVVLNNHAAALLRAEQSRHPELSAAEIIEAALASKIDYGPPPEARLRTPEEIRAWLDELAANSWKIPAMPSETFSREMIYQDHD